MSSIRLKKRTEGRWDRIENGIRTRPGGPYDPECDADRQLMTDIYLFVDEELRRIVMGRPQIGPNAVDGDHDHLFQQFTELLNTAFGRILGHQPDSGAPGRSMAHADKLVSGMTRSELTGFVTRAMQNLMIDHYRRDQRKADWDMVERAANGEANANPMIARMIAIREKRFAKVRIEFHDMLLAIEDWSSTDDANLHRYAEALRLYGVYGVSMSQAAREMGITRKEFETLFVDILQKLRGGT